MRRITNKHNLPEALVRAVQNDNYTKGGSDYSTTQLSKPSRIIALEKQHEDEIEEDVSDRIYALIGKLGHSILEHSGTADIIEKRLFCDIAGKVLSGQVDIVDGTVLEDWKFTSIFTSKEGVKTEWIAQASVNRYLCEKNGIPITSARYIAIYRDWSKPKVERDKTYPQSQVECFDVPMWSLEDTEEWIIKRINAHESALVELPQCTDEDRWARSGGWALMKKGRKTAIKLYETEEEAKKAITEGSMYVEQRMSDSMRCKHYCPVAPFCEQYKRITGEIF